MKVKNDNFKRLGYVGIEINAEDIKKLVETCRKYNDKFEKNLDYIKPISLWKTCKKSQS